MSNGKVQTNPETEPQNTSENERKSRIKMGIQRTLSTAKFESIVIHYEIDEEITWSNTPEGKKLRAKKVDNWRTIATQEFQQIHDRVLEELKLSHKRAYFVNHLEKDNRPDPNEPNEFDNLDELDSLS